MLLRIGFWKISFALFVLLLGFGCGSVAPKSAHKEKEPGMSFVPSEKLSASSPAAGHSELDEPDNVTPSENKAGSVSGLPSDKPQDPNLVDFSNSSRWIGDSCSSNSDCSYPGGFCLLPQNGYPLGQCSKSCTKYCPDRRGKAYTFCIRTTSGRGLCMSRCNRGIHRGNGCRADYFCKLRSRRNQSKVRKTVCYPDTSKAGSGSSGSAGENGRVDKPKPRKPAPGSQKPDPRSDPNASCYDQLKQMGVNFVRVSNPNKRLSGASQRCSIRQPVRLTPPILGVDWVIWTGKRYNMTASCRLALSLAKLSIYLKNRGIKKVMHLGTYNCRKIRGSSKLSKHSFGGAIDIGGFWTQNGTEYSLVKHWDHQSKWKDSRGRMGCWTTTFNSVKAKILYDIACDMWKKRLFSLILTPNFNRDHDNHFHCDFSSTGKVLSESKKGSNYSIGVDQGAPVETDGTGGKRAPSESDGSEYKSKRAPVGTDGTGGKKASIESEGSGGKKTSSESEGSGGKKTSSESEGSGTCSH